MGAARCSGRVLSAYRDLPPQSLAPTATDARPIVPAGSPRRKEIGLDPYRLSGWPRTDRGIWASEDRIPLWGKGQGRCLGAVTLVTPGCPIPKRSESVSDLCRCKAWDPGLQVQPAALGPTDPQIHQSTDSQADPSWHPAVTLHVESGFFSSANFLGEK